MMAEYGEPWAVRVGHLPRVEPGECESAPRQYGVTPNWCTPLWTDLLNDWVILGQELTENLPK
jgi:hypothetical protein